MTKKTAGGDITKAKALMKALAYLLEPCLKWYLQIGEDSWSWLSNTVSNAINFVLVRNSWLDGSIQIIMQYIFVATCLVLFIIYRSHIVALKTLLMIPAMIFVPGLPSLALELLKLPPMALLIVFVNNMVLYVIAELVRIYCRRNHKRGKLFKCILLLSLPCSWLCFNLLEEQRENSDDVCETKEEFPLYWFY